MLNLGDLIMENSGYQDLPAHTTEQKKLVASIVGRQGDDLAHHNPSYDDLGCLYCSVCNHRTEECPEYSDWSDSDEGWPYQDMLQNPVEDWTDPEDGWQAPEDGWQATEDGWQAPEDGWQDP